MNINKMTIQQIEQLAKEKVRSEQAYVDKALLEALKSDSRKGVKRLAEWYLRRVNEIKRENKRLKRIFKFETILWNKGINYVAGIDEAGRGPLAGPVVAAAVILPKGIRIRDINDSKKLTPEKRDRLYDIIYEKALAVSYKVVDNHYIDKHNIHNATLFAMEKAVEGLKIRPQFLLIDAMRIKSSIPKKILVGGDRKSASIAAASIIAKVTRDRIMIDFHNRYPQYGFDKHKGYPTREHVESIKKHGFSPIHRRSFKVK